MRFPCNIIGLLVILHENKRQKSGFFKNPFEKMPSRTSNDIFSWCCFVCVGRSRRRRLSLSLSLVPIVVTTGKARFIHSQDGFKHYNHCRQ